MYRKIATATRIASLTTLATNAIAFIMTSVTWSVDTPDTAWSPFSAMPDADFAAPIAPAAAKGSMAKNGVY